MAEEKPIKGRTVGRWGARRSSASCIQLVHQNHPTTLLCGFLGLTQADCPRISEGWGSNRALPTSSHDDFSIAMDTKTIITW